MPQKPKFTRDEIVSVGLEIARAEGADALTARAVGAKLGSSARPIFTVFENMEDLYDAVSVAARDKLITYLSESLDYWPAFKEFGLRLVRYAIEQPHLYEMLFTRRVQSDSRTPSANSFASCFLELADPLTDEVQELFDLSRDDARELINQMVIFANGIASFYVSGIMDFSEEQISRSISEACVGMALRFKIANGSFDFEQAQTMASQPDITPRKRNHAER